MVTQLLIRCTLRRSFRLYGIFLFLFVFAQPALSQELAPEGDHPISLSWEDGFKTDFGFAKSVSGNPPENPEHGQSLEMLTERSHPSHDPSRKSGFHLELRAPKSQEKLISSALINSFTQKVNSLNDQNDLYDQLPSENGSLPKNQWLYELRTRYDGRNISIENTTTFVNSDYEFYGISDRKYGFCWGVSTLNRYFTYLALFNPNAKKHESAPLRIDLEYYEKLIQQITSGEVAVIDGFKNLRDFSSHPGIELLLKLRSMVLWQERAVKASSIKIFYGVGGYSETKKLSPFFQKLRYRIDAGHLTKILFTAKISHKILGGQADIHAVLVDRIEKVSDRETKIFVWDPNFYGEDMQKEQQYLDFIKAGPTTYQIYYKPWMDMLPDGSRDVESGRVGRIFIAPEDAVEMKNIEHSLSVFCSDPSKSSFCKK